MEVSLVRAWATPSTIHLRLCVEVGKQRHLLFRDLHVPLSAIEGLLTAETHEPIREPGSDQPLPGMP